MPSLSIVILGLYSSLAIAQSIIPSSQPACIQSCSAFIQAQQACVTDIGQQALYQSCFCQSAYLSGIKGNPANNICPNCATGDWNTITGWYQGLCGGGGGGGAAGTPPPAAGQNPPTGPPAAGAAPGNAATTSTTGQASSATAGGGTYLSSSDNPANYTDASSW